jgi:predicted anti-sigma-YlaC factor YlaD
MNLKVRLLRPMAALTPALVLVLVLGGCSVRHLVVDKAGDALSGDGSVMARDDDPELVRAAVPFSLKVMEGLLAQNPRHLGLLLAATSGFTQYSYAFVQQDADRLEEQDYAASLELRQRARRLYLRARDYGLQGLEVRHPQLRAALAQDAAAAVRPLQRAELPLLYWTTVSWAAAISQAKDDPALIGDLAQVDALAERASALDPDFDAGALQGFLISYEMARAGRVAIAREHFARAVALGQGHYAAPYVSLAESVCVGERARSEFLELLGQALAIDADRYPDLRLENLIMQRRARWLRDHVDDLFLPEAGIASPESSR